VSEAQPLPERGEGGRFLPRAEAPQRSQERQKLAAAIAYLGALDGQLQRLAEARGRLGLRDKERALDSARRGLDEARGRAPAILVAKALGEPVAAAQTVEHAQGLLEDTQRSLDEARSADRVLRDEIKLVEDRRSAAQIARDSALDAVLRSAPEVAALGDPYAAARQQMYDLTWVFSALGGQAALPGNFFWDGVLWGSDRGAGTPWRAARVALERDAAASLPGE
jgi:hypothetical protein